MSIYFGNDTVNDLYIGLTPVSKGYVGTHLFYNGDNTIIDFTYEKYILNTQFSTLYNTAEKPVKSAILKGNTLVNLAPKMVDNVVSNYQSGNVVITSAFKPSTNLKANTEYTVFFKASEVVNAKSGQYQYEGRDVNNTFVENKMKEYTLVNGYNKLTFTPTVELSKVQFLSYNTFNIGGACRIHGDSVMLIEGNHSNEEILYFTGMQSAKMPVLTTTGKNLFDGKLENGAIVSSTGVDTPSADNVRSIGYIKVNANASIVISNDLNYSNSTIYEYDANKKYIGRQYTNPFTTSENCHYIRFRSDANQPNLNVKYQIEYGTKATSYEPFKSNILTVNEPVELRKVGKIQDELNLLTGELTQRIGEVVLDGSEGWTWYNETTNAIIVYTTNPLPNHLGVKYTNSQMVTNYLDIADSIESGKDGCYISDSGRFNLAISKTKATSINELKQYLQSTPLVVQHLQTESVKTVDLSVVDQDGNDTELSTFNDITHVTLSSEGLISEAELEVATKNEEILNTMSLEMDDISTTQTTLEETSNTQSENVDATMLATTEIYEQLL